jgi:hypothetical protein
MQTTQYVKSVKSEGVSLAYRVSGETGPTLLHVPGAISNLSLEEQGPNAQRYFERMSRFCRAVRFDKRATGLSDSRTAARRRPPSPSRCPSSRRCAGR